MIEFIRNLRRYGLEYYAKYYGSYRGIVVSNEDPQVIGRLKVCVPAIHGNDYPDYWAPSKGMPLGQDMALWILPKRGDVIWVSFENGDVRYPIWEYGPYIKKGGVPTGAEVKDNYFFQSPAGQRIEFNDTDLTLTVKNASGSVIKMLKDGRINIQNNNDNLKDLIKDMMTETINLEIITPQGPGSVGPTSMSAILKLQIRLLKLLS